MNLFLPQEVQTRTELEMIANVKYQIVGAKDSNPIIGCQQDGVTGSYLVTLDDVRIPAEDVAFMLANTESADLSKLSKKKIYTGKEVFSAIIPDGINSLEKKDGKTRFQVKDGNLLIGNLNKAKVASKKNSLIHFVWDKKGGEVTRKFIDDIQKLVLNYLLVDGFTVGFGDCFIDKKVMDDIRKQIQEKMLETNYEITEMENQADSISYDTYEANLAGDLNSFGSNLHKLAGDNLPKDNGFYVLSFGAKAKGSQLNIGKMVSCMSQQSVEGKRPKKRVNGRALTHFHYNDDTPQARGFAANNFLTGLRGHEYFFHSMGGREGLIDTAIKSVTWETPIVLIENGEPKYTEIGKWIDNLLDNNKDKVKHYTERDMELLDTDNMYIPTTDYEGNVSWGKISAVTRHDPGKELYEIKTSGGRSVIVTESKSLLIWNERINEFREKLTPEIKIGDLVPVTETLKNPPIIKKYVDMRNYLHPNKYVYGSDYNKAIDMMEFEMKNRKHIPSGWWNTNNGNTFSLPFTKKSSLQRSKVRANQDNIELGYIYPYGAQRGIVKIPDKFELNEINGIFIGLFIAEGNCDKNSIRITNINDNIIEFVKNWFENHKIKFDISSKQNKIGGISRSIRGYSGILSTFLKEFVGHRAENKFIPSEAFIASDIFIKGLLNGYFSGDGCVTKNSIDASSASKRLIEGINMLCSRFGIYGKAYTTILKKNNIGTKSIKPSHRLRISAQWAKRFSEEITLLHEDKNLKMKSKKWIESHRNFKVLNNVVLDNIIEINKIDIKDHPKVYDLTIPETFNFGLANGLQVRDTASTGYIQRRLVKTMEDLMVNYDGTVRNSSGQIIQFIYGDNGIDQTVQADNRFYCLEEDNKTLESKYIMTDKEVKQTKTSPKSNQTYKKEFITLRDKIRESYIEGSLESSMTEGFLLPINLYRMVQDEMDETRKLKYDLTGDYILEQINEILVDPKTDLIAKQIETSLRKLQDENEHLAKQVVKLGMLEYLSPKRCIYEYHLNKDQFDRLIQDIKQSFLKAVVNPGEMVGVIAAQSIGEPCTQMTLNTKHFAGVAGKSAATSGVPRIEEIFGYSKNIKTPIMTMYFDKENDQNEDLGKTITSSMNHITIRELINNVEIYYYDEKSKSELNDKIKGDEISTKGAFFLNTKKNIEQFPWLIRLELDREKMLDLEVVLLNIKTRILSYYYGVIQNTKTMKRDEKEIWQTITGGVVLSNLDTSDVPTIHIRLGLNNINFQILTKFLKIVLDDVKLKGVGKISSAVFTKELKPSYDEKTGELLKKKIVEINTAGINMEEVRKYRFIDHNKTYLNDMETIRKYYGMEAVRSFLIIELARTFKTGGVGVPNYAHLSMIADLMTYTGEVVSVDRHGANRVDLDPMARASFERTMDHFVNASIFNEKDKIRATASKIMVGQVIPGGTGAFELVLDTEKLANSEYLDDEYQGRTTFDGFQANPFMEDILQTDKVNVDFLT